MRYLFLFTLLLVIAGCSSTYVHLYARYLDDEEQKTIVKLLEQERLTVVVNTHEFPKEISDTSIVYSLFMSKPTVVPKIKTLMGDSTWPVSHVSSLVAGQHWFQNNSIGLFVVPKDINPQAGQSMADLSKIYENKKCNQPVKLQLYANGNYQFSETVGNDKYSYGKSGKWRVDTFPFIEMRPKNKGRRLYFEVVKSITQDRVSLVNIISLKPMDTYAGIEHCEFYSGERE